MKTREQILEAVKAGRKSGCEMIDSRDYARLTAFFPAADWNSFGFESKEDGQNPEPLELSEANVIEQLKGDIAFAFEKALGKRGISASLMQEVVKMWLWVLDDPLQDHDDYPQYGLPLLKAVAVKYGLPNPIGDDAGNEWKYEQGGE
jgi:hypothetical protein